MTAEHELGRRLIREIAAATLAYTAGELGARQRWSSAARGYANLLPQHIAKENNVLFPMAERLLTQTEQQELAAAFDKVEEEKLGAGTHERLHALMEKLLAEVFQKQP